MKAQRIVLALMTALRSTRLGAEAVGRELKNSLRWLFLLTTILVFPYAILAHAIEPSITDVKFGPDGKTLVAVSQKGIEMYSWPDLRHQRTVDSASTNIHCIAFSPNGQQFAVGGGEPSESGAVEVFSWPSGKAIAAIAEHEDSVMSVVWRNDEQFFSASHDRLIQLCDVKQRASVRECSGHSRGVSGISFLSREETLVSVGDDQSVRVWDSTTGKLARSLSQHTKPIRAVALSPSKEGLPMVASAAEDRTIRFWQPTIGRMVRYVRLAVEPLDIVWTVDGSKVLAACVDGHVRVVDPVEVTVTHDLPAIDGWAYAIAVHPTDGTIAVGGANGQLRRLSLNPEPKLGDADFPSPTPSERHTQKVAAVKEGDYDLVLIGDSITHTVGELDGKYEPMKAVWQKHYAPLNAINLGYNGYRTEQILWNLQNGELDFKRSPKVAVLLIGTNNTDDRNFKKVHSAEEVFAGTKAIVDLIREKHPSTKILVLRIFPRGGDDEKGVSPPPFNSSKQCIETCLHAGELTKQLADDKHVFWLDVNYVFLNKDGTINTELMWDLLHPSPAGADAWAEAVKPTLVKLIGN